MSNREISVEVIVKGARPEEAIFIQYLIDEALSTVQHIMSPNACEREVIE